MKKTKTCVGLLSLVMWIALSANICQAALLGHWKLDEASGQTVIDSVGLNNGTLGATGTVSAVDDPTRTTSAKIGSRALSFDGGDWVNFGDVLDLGTSDFTVSVWMQANSSIGAFPGGRIFQTRGTGGGGAVAGWQLGATLVDASNFRFDNIIWDDAGGTAGSRLGWITTNLASGSTFPNAALTRPLNQWQNLTTVFDNTNKLFQIYINGTLAQSKIVGTPYGSVSNSRVLALGAGSDNGTSITQGFNGLIDDPGIFSGSLGAGYVGAIYSLGDNSALNYDLSLVEDLFDVHQELTSSATIGGLTWTRATDLTTPLGVVTEIDGAYYLTLDGLGTGVTSFQAAPVPEPNTALLMLCGGLGFVARRRRKIAV